MSWQLSISLFFLFSVMQSLWQRVYLKTSTLPESIPPAFAYLFGVMPLAIIVGLATRHIHVDWGMTTVLLLIGEGIFIGLFNWLSYKAIKRMHISQFQVIFQLYGVTAVVFGWLLLGERLSPAQLVGSALLITGALLAATSHKQQKSIHGLRNDAVFLAAMAAVSLGIGLVIEKAALGRMDMGAYFIFGFGTQTIALLVIAAHDLPKLRREHITWPQFRGPLAFGILSCLIGFTYIYALRKVDNVSLVTMVSTFQLPLTVLAAFIILKERDNLTRLALACTIGFVGLLINTIH